MRDLARNMMNVTGYGGIDEELQGIELVCFLGTPSGKLLVLHVSGGLLGTLEIVD